jgi:hypothetical protein
MIDTIMRNGSEVVFIRVSNTNVYFSTSSNRDVMSTIEGLQLSKEGVYKEFPELKGNDNWRIEAIAKFKDKIKSLGNEDKIIDFLIKDLQKFGYVPLKKMKVGFRPTTIK